jgi:hypothetical protein
MGLYHRTDLMTLRPFPCDSGGLLLRLHALAALGLLLIGRTGRGQVWEQDASPFAAWLRC